MLWPRGFYALIEGRFGRQLTSLTLERTGFDELFDVLAATPGFGQLETFGVEDVEKLESHKMASGWFAAKDSS